MGLGDLTLLLVGRDTLAQQLLVHLEQRGADIESTEASEALDTVRVAVPDLIVLSNDASASDGERIRDGLMAAGKPPRVLALCDKKVGAKVATFKHDFIAALEHDTPAELLASCIEALCALMDKPSSTSRPLRSLVADVRRSHIPSKPSKPAVVAATKATKPAPIASKTKTLTSLAPHQPSQPTPLAAFLNAPPAAAAKIVISMPAPAAASKPIAPPVVAAPEPPPPAPIIAAPEPPPIIAEPASLEDELDISLSSAPPPSLPVASPPSLPIATSPSPTPLFVETQAATPAQPATPATSLEPSPLERARALALRIPRNQRYAASAALMLCVAFVAAVSASDDDEEPIAPHAAASIRQATTETAIEPASTTPAPAPVPEPVAAAPSPAPEPQLAAAPPSPVTESADDSEEPEDSMVDGELYDPHADPARAKANYLVNMGHRLRKQGRLGMAEASYLKALNAMPNYARAVSGLVAVHLGRRDGVEALRWAKKLVELQPKRGAHQRLLGDAYELAGKKTEARAAWQLAVRLGDRTSRSRL